MKILKTAHCARILMTTLCSLNELTDSLSIKRNIGRSRSIFPLKSHVKTNFSPNNLGRNKLQKNEFPLETSAQEDRSLASSINQLQDFLNRANEDDPGVLGCDTPAPLGKPGQHSEAGTASGCSARASLLSLQREGFITEKPPLALAFRHTCASAFFTGSAGALMGHAKLNHPSAVGSLSAPLPRACYTVCAAPGHL